MLNFRKLYRKYSSSVLLLVFFSMSSATAQPDRITVSVSVPEWVAGGMTDAVFEPFEAAHPGVDVVYVPPGERQFIPSPAISGLDEHLQGVKAYASMADVLSVSSLHEVRVESTRAGYWLDLEPLITNDPHFDASDFHPALLESYQWERGTWALPVKANIQLLYYDRDAFDAAGIPYPHSDWTLENFATAVRALATHNPDGSVNPALASWDDTLFIYSLLNGSLYESDAVEQFPDFASTELEYVLETWAALYDEGVIRSLGSMLSPQDVPMFIDYSWALYNIQERNLGAVLLPNRTALLGVSAFAVSGGSQYPELAYALAEYLTRTPEVVAYMSGDVSARLKVDLTEVDGAMARLTSSAEQQALISEAMENAVPLAELNYRDYLTSVLSEITFRRYTGDITPLLEESAADLREAYTAASTYAETNTFAVNAPPQRPILAEGEIVLTLGVNVSVSPLPNQELWQAFIEEFVITDPQVGYVDLFTRWQASPRAYFDNSDCVVGSSSLSHSIDASVGLALTPLLEVDPDFDSTEYLDSVLSMVQRERVIWGLPLATYTEMLWYRPEVFEELDLTTPVDGWTIAQFGELVSAVQEVNPDQAILVPDRGDSNYLLMLMAAYGTLPFDYRTQPPTVNLTDPAVMVGIQQVLDLAREGMIKYQELDRDSTSMVISGLVTNPPSILIPATMNDYGFPIPRNLSGDIGDYQLTTYPSGTDYTPVILRLTAGYISAGTSHIDACYRLLKALSKRPDLLNGLPVRDLDSIPELMLREGNQKIDMLYHTLAASLKQPNVVIMGRDTRFMSYQEDIWLRQAFDSYVLENANLEAVMEETQRKITEYRACITGLPEQFQVSLGTSSESVIVAQEAYLTCAEQADTNADRK